MVILVSAQQDPVRVLTHKQAALGRLTSFYWVVYMNSPLIFVPSLGLFILTGLFLTVEF